MPGQFNPQNRPLRPGAYFDFQAQTPQPTLVSANAVVGLPFTHSWGPENKPVKLNQFGDFIQLYGQGGTTPPTYTPGYIAVRQCFTGEGVPGRAGAGQVVGYRMVGAAGLASTTTLQNTTPAAALTLTAVYKGTYGNKISVAVIADPTNPTTQLDLQIFVEGSLVETFVFNKTDVVGLAAQINSATTGSKWVTAASLISGVALAVVSTPVALASGNDGSTLIAGDWTAMMNAMGIVRWSVFAPFDLPGDTQSSLHASLVSWAQGLNATGHRAMFVTGGSAADTATTATTRANAINTSSYGGVQGAPDVLTIGVGTYSDSVLGTLSTSQLAPRLAGIIAARNESQGLSFARLAGLSIVSGPSNADILTGIQQGFMTIGQDSNPDAPVRFEKGITTYTTAVDSAKPVSVYSNPKFLRTMELLEMEITEFAETNVVGLMAQDPATVQYVIGQVKQRLRRRELDNIILAGWTVAQQTSPPPLSTDDFIWLVYSLLFGRDVEQVLNTVIVG